MKLANNEREVLEYIQDGIEDSSQIGIFAGLEDAQVKNIMEKLEFLGLIRITKKPDEYENWSAEILSEDENNIW